MSCCPSEVNLTGPAMSSLWGVKSLCQLIDLSTTARLPHHRISMNLEARCDIAWWQRLSLIHTGQDPQIWPSLQMHLGTLDMAFTTLVIGLLTPGQFLFKAILSNGRSSILLLLPASCGVIRGQERKISFIATIRQLLISGLLALPEIPTSCTLSAPYFSVVLLTISQS